MTAIALYEKLAPLDFKHLEPAYDRIRNQYQEIQNDVFENSFTGYGKTLGLLMCKDRQTDSPIVPLSQPGPLRTIATKDIEPK
jgi:hypothetical protein